MADHTKIEWTDATWNPITGCSVVSPGCTNCYAMRLAGTRLKHHPSRAGLTRDTKAGPVWTGEVRFNPQWLDQPLRRSKPRMIFVCAHGDLFAEGVEDAWLDQIFAVMALSPQHTFQVLTKRPERAREYLRGTRSSIPFLGRMPLERVHLEVSGHFQGDGGIWDKLKAAGNVYSLYCSVPWPLPNVWLGVSCEDQRRADERVPILLDTPAAIRWVSAEPLLGPIDFRRIRIAPDHHTILDALDGYAIGDAISESGQERTKLDWIVAGGESGPGARPMHPEWVRSIRNQCAAAGVSFLFKQWGAWAPVCEMDDDQIDRCYRPAPEQYPDATRTCVVDQHVLHTDGSRHGIIEPMAFLQGTGAMTMMNISKTRAGRLLDGVEHNGFPGTVDE